MYKTRMCYGVLFVLFISSMACAMDDEPEEGGETFHHLTSVTRMGSSNKSTGSLPNRSTQSTNILRRKTQSTSVLPKLPSIEDKKKCKKNRTKSLRRLTSVARMGSSNKSTSILPGISSFDDNRNRSLSRASSESQMRNRSNSTEVSTIALMQAIKNNDHSRVQNFLKRDIDLNYQTKKRCTLLHEAIYNLYCNKEKSDAGIEQAKQIFMELIQYIQRKEGIQSEGQRVTITTITTPQEHIELFKKKNKKKQTPLQLAQACYNKIEEEGIFKKTFKQVVNLLDFMAASYRYEEQISQEENDDEHKRLTQTPKPSRIHSRYPKIRRTSSAKEVSDSKKILKNTQRLFEKIRASDLQGVQELLAEDVFINFQDKTTGNRPLHEAVINFLNHRNDSEKRKHFFSNARLIVVALCQYPNIIVERPNRDGKTALNLVEDFLLKKSSHKKNPKYAEAMEVLITALSTIESLNQAQTYVNQTHNQQLQVNNNADDNSNNNPM